MALWLLVFFKDDTTGCRATGKALAVFLGFNELRGIYSAWESWPYILQWLQVILS